MSENKRFQTNRETSPELKALLRHELRTAWREMVAHAAAVHGCVGTGTDEPESDQDFRAWVSDLGVMYHWDSIVEVDHDGCTADAALPEVRRG